jgi:glucose/mannose-6-phosphate isomerase
MTILDDLESIKTLDSDDVLGTVGRFSKQIEQAWNEAKKIEIPRTFRDIHQVVFAGMGGSALGPHLIASLYQSGVNRPLIVIRGYHLPPYVNKKSLVVLCSYSGTTEETLSCAQDALKAGARLIAVTSGGKLAELARGHNFPLYQFKPTYNTSAPRYGSGYMTIGPLAMLARLKLVKVGDEQIKNLIGWLGRRDDFLNAKIPLENNVAKKTAQEMKNRIPILVSAGFLDGAAHVFANQVNETGKNFSTLFSIPELNHHLMEGLKFPSENPKNLIFLFINSRLYPRRIQKRFEISKDVVSQHGIELLEFVPDGQTKLDQAFEVVQFASYVTFYQAMLNAVDPSPNPWVDYFKEKMG